MENCKKCSVFSKESGPSYCHEFSARLGTYSGHNNSRDFWRSCKIPVDPWLDFTKVVQPVVLDTLYTKKDKQFFGIYQIWYRYIVLQSFHVASNTCILFVAKTCAKCKEPTKVVAPIKAPKEPCGFRNVELEVLEPHKVIHYLFDECEVDIPSARVHDFWDHHRSVNAPWLEGCDASRDHVPIGLYGDGARCRQQAYRPVEKVFGIFLSLPLWRPKSSRFSRWLLFSIDETLLFGRKTLNKVFALITWSINMMFWGRFPRVDMHGQRLQSDLAGQSLTKHNRCFALTEFRGDWSYFKLIFGLTSSWKGGANVPVCFLCKAFGKGPPATQYYHIDENASCWGTIYNKVEFLAAEMPDEDLCFSAHFIENKMYKLCQLCRFQHVCFQVCLGGDLHCHEPWFYSVAEVR